MQNSAHLPATQQRLVSGDCLACLAYFAIATNQCDRSELLDSLARNTTPTSTHDYNRLHNWWDSKLRNIQWAFAAAGLYGISIHNRTIARPRSRGREGQAGTQRRIRQYAITYFLTNPFLCTTLAKHCFRTDSTISPRLTAALFSWAESSTVEPPALAAEEACSPDDQGGLHTSTGDTRESALRAIRVRRGQQAFRDSLRLRYGDRCVVTQCDVLDVLEAAHIKPYRGATDHHPENGLLLRADIHTLFDVHLLAVDPAHWRVWTHPRVRVTYPDLHERPLQIPPHLRPSATCVAEHFAVAQGHL